MRNNCIICDKEISSGDIFMKVEIDMKRLTYNETEDEKNFLVPNGPVHSTAKFYLCDICSHGLMRQSLKDIAMSIIKNKDMTEET